MIITINTEVIDFVGGIQNSIVYQFLVRKFATLQDAMKKEYVVVEVEDKEWWEYCRISGSELETCLSYLKNNDFIRIVKGYKGSKRDGYVINTYKYMEFENNRARAKRNSDFVLRKKPKTPVSTPAFEK